MDYPFFESQLIREGDIGLTREKRAIEEVKG